MKKELGTPAATVGAFALTCLFGGLTLAIYPGWPAIGRWLDRTDAPAWVQAVGSILAIAGAGGIAFWQTYSARLDADRARRRIETERALAVSFILRRAGIVVGNAERAVASGSTGSVKLAIEQVDMVQRALRSLPVFDIPSARLVFDLQRVDRDLLYVLRFLNESAGRRNRPGTALFQRVQKRIHAASYACVIIFDHDAVQGAHLTGLGPLDDEDS